jgi:hypothetical protein
MAVINQYRLRIACKKSLTRDRVMLLAQGSRKNEIPYCHSFVLFISVLFAYLGFVCLSLVVYCVCDLCICVLYCRGDTAIG